MKDKRVLGLIRQFLAAGIMRESGSLAATPSGIAQGAILSPLLANVALSVLDRHFERAWHAHSGAVRNNTEAGLSPHDDEVPAPTRLSGAPLKPTSRSFWAAWYLSGTHPRGISL